MVLRAPHLHTGVGGRAALAARAERRPHRLRRRLPRLGLPRGRLPLRGAGRRGTGGALVSASRAASTGRRYRHGRPHARALRVPRSRHACAGSRSHARSCATAPTMWLVDLDAPAALPRSAAPVRPVRRRATTSATRPSASGRTGRFLATRGVDLDGGRVLMLANARVLGHVFNPLTVYWCHDPTARLACVVAEVHNTYGERHCYLLRHRRRRPGGDGQGVLRLAVPPVAGDYRMRAARCPTDRLGSRSRCASAATPRWSPRPCAAPGGRPPRGHCWPGCCCAPAGPAAHRHALIRRHGIALWLRRLPVIPGPARIRRKDA